jgi:HK97 family phage major capsid protein
MNKTLVKMLSTVKDYKADEHYEIDAETAQKWIAAEVAEQASPSALLDSKLGDLQKTLKERDEQLISKITDAVKVPVEAPAVHTKKQKPSFTNFLGAVAKNDRARLEGEYGSKTVTGSDGASGGYTIPTQFGDTMYEVAVEKTFCLDKVSRIPMETDHYEEAAFDQSGTDSGQSNFLAGVTATWTEDDESKPESDPKFRRICLDAKELSFSTTVQNYLLKDSPLAIQNRLLQKFAQAYAWTTEYAILNGNGVGKPLGVMNSAAQVVIPRQNSDQFVLKDADAMVAQLHSTDDDAVMWVAHKLMLPQLAQLASPLGQVVWIANAREKMPMIMFGHPVVFTEKVTSQLGTQGDIALIDFSQYLHGVREELVIAVSEHVNFLKGQTVFRMTGRQDGRTGLNAPVTLADGATQVSPVVITRRQTTWICRYTRD